MSYSNKYNRIIELLLSGEFICEVTHESYYAYLSDSQNRDRINEYLIVQNRKVRQTSDKKAFMCAYADMDRPDVKREIRAQFKEVSNELESFVRLMSTMLVCQPHNDPIRSGDIVNEADLLNAINASQVICERLDELCRKGLFASNATTPKDKLKQVFKKLVERKYLIPIGHSGLQYQATAKWSWLYDNMHFIRAHEDIEIQDPESEQRGLF